MNGPLKYNLSVSGLVEEGYARVMAFPSSSVESCLSPYSNGGERVRERVKYNFNGMPLAVS